MTPFELEATIDQRIESKMEEIATLAAEKAVAHFYEQLGRNVFKKAAFVIGIGVLVLLTWLVGKGILPLKP